MRQGVDKVMMTSQTLMKDIIHFTLGKQAIYGGIKFNENDSIFDNQEILVLLPKIITVPVETMVNLLSSGLSEKNKDIFVGYLADTCCEKLEVFINQVIFDLFYILTNLISFFFSEYF